MRVHSNIIKPLAIGEVQFDNAGISPIVLSPALPVAPADGSYSNFPTSPFAVLLSQQV
jgi:hypothetical protein